MNALSAAVMVYITAISAILVLKPSYFHNYDGPKNFGVGSQQCLMPYYLAALVPAITIYFITLILNNKMTT